MIVKEKFNRKLFQPDKEKTIDWKTFINNPIDFYNFDLRNYKFIHSHVIS